MSNARIRWMLLTKLKKKSQTKGTELKHIIKITQIVCLNRERRKEEESRLSPTNKYWNSQLSYRRVVHARNAQLIFFFFFEKKIALTKNRASNEHVISRDLFWCDCFSRFHGFMIERENDLLFSSIWILLIFCLFSLFISAALNIEILIQHKTTLIVFVCRIQITSLVDLVVVPVGVIVLYPISI